MSNRYTLAGLFAATTTLLLMMVASPAMAQSSAEVAHTPKVYPRAELINFGTYDKAPLTFEWPVVDVRQEPIGNRLQFVITLDVDLTSAVDFFEGAFADQDPVATLAPGVLPFNTERDLVVVGHSASGNPASFTLSGTGTTRRFTIKLTGEGSKTVVTLDNRMSSQLFSGVVPPRVGFQPAGASVVNFLYN
jgi:hypothetical protein